MLILKGYSTASVHKLKYSIIVSLSTGMKGLAWSWISCRKVNNDQNYCILLSAVTMHKNNLVCAKLLEFCFFRRHSVSLWVFVWLTYMTRNSNVKTNEDTSIVFLGWYWSYCPLLSYWNILVSVTRIKKVFNMLMMSLK